MATGRIIGVLQCRDEWGLVAVAISHVLANHADEVVVVNDNSSDLSVQGLAHLQRLWGDRLRIVHVATPGIHQEAVANMVVHMEERSPDDWIYVFDADEFLVIEGGRTLRTYLDAIPPEVGGFLYQVHNFIAPRDFVPDLLGSYQKLTHRAVVVHSNDNPLRNYELIHNGAATFFDMAFPPKTIYRYSEMAQLKSGSHALVTHGPPRPTLTPNDIRCCHLPYPAFGRLDRKARHGEHHVRRRDSRVEGWQAQLVYALEQQGRLDWFWERHSLSAEDDQNGPAHVADHALAEALAPTLALLADHFGSDDLRVVDGVPLAPSRAAESALPIGDVIRLTARLQKQNRFLFRYIADMRRKSAPVSAGGPA